MDFFQIRRPSDYVYQLNSRSYKNYKNKNIDLEKVTEESLSEYKSSLSRITYDDSSVSSDHSGPIVNKELQSKFFFEFLEKLLKFKVVYNYFIRRAFYFNALVPLRTRLPAREGPRSNKRASKLLVISSNIPDYEKKLRVTSNKSISPGYIRGQGASSYTPKLVSKKKLDDAESSQESSRISTPLSKLSRLRNKKIPLDKSNTKLKEIFMTIASSSTKIDKNDFKRFLELRYPVPVVEVLINNFQFSDTSFEDYVKAMNKFIDLDKRPHLKLCFNIFDFNKDKHICFKDTFTAIELRRDNYYDSDLVIIKQTLFLKKEGKLDSNRLHKRKSTFSLLKEKLEEKQHLELEPKKIIENPKLTLKDFENIEFNARPQILIDFISYTCNFNYLLEKGFFIPRPPRSNRNSENIVMEMENNFEFHEKMRKSEKYDYYCALDQAMRLYSLFEIEDILKKFAYLKSEDNLTYKVITKKSMTQKFVIFM